MRLLTLCFLLFLAESTSAQLVFSIEGPYFQGQNIQHISVNKEEVWLIHGDDKRGLSLFSSNSKLETDFSEEISSITPSELLCTYTDNVGEVFIGTQNDYMYSFTNYTDFFKYDKNLGLLNPRVNSIKRNGIEGLMSNYPDQYIIAGTDSGFFFYQEDSLKVTRMRLGYTNYYDTSIIQETYQYSFTYFNYYNSDYYNISCGGYNKQSSVYYLRNSVYLSNPPMTFLGSDKTNEMIVVGKYRVWESQALIAIGTNNGIVHHEWSCFYFGIYPINRYLVGRNVKAVQFFSFLPVQLTNGLKFIENDSVYIGRGDSHYYLAGTDSGLYAGKYVSNSPFSEYQAIENTENWQINDIKVDNCFKHIWLATTHGLYKMIPEIDFSRIVREAPGDNLPDTVYLCENSNTILFYDHGGRDISWQKDNEYLGVYTKNLIVNDPGVYRVVVSDCYLPFNLYSRDVHVLIEDRVQFNYDFPSIIEICKDESTELAIDNFQNLQIDWYKDGSILIQNVDAVNVNEAGSYWAQIYNCNTNMLSTSIVEVKLLNIGDAYSVLEVFESCGENAQARVTISGLENYTHINWTKDDEELTNYNNQNAIVIDEPGLYSAMVILRGSILECKLLVNEQNVDFFENPEFEINGVSDFCEGEALNISLIGNNLSYTVNGQATNELSFRVDDSNSFIIQATNENGCTTEKSFSVVKNPNPDFYLPDNIQFCFGYGIPFELEFSSTLYQYHVNGQLVVNQTYPFSKSDKYNIVGTDPISGCQSIKEFLPAEVCPELFIPNIITPNEDGYNDFFEIKGILPNSMLRIYNRWGKEIYSSNNYSGNWKANNIQNGVYYYDFFCPYRSYSAKGTIQVLR